MLVTKIQAFWTSGKGMYTVLQEVMSLGGDDAFFYHLALINGVNLHAFYEDADQAAHRWEE